MEKNVLEFIIKSNQAELYRYVKYLGGDSTTAADVVQDTFLAAFNSKKVPDMDNPPIRGAWLRAIARNTFLKYCRKRKASKEIADPDIMEQAERYWVGEFLREEDGFDYIEALRGCVEKLDEKGQALVFMRYSERKSREVLARTFEMSEDGIKSFLRRVRTALGKCVSTVIGQEWEDAEPELSQ